MTRARWFSTVPAVLALLAACSSDEPSSGGSVVPASTTTTQPATTQPATIEPATTDPVSTGPVTTEPVGSEPCTTHGDMNRQVSDDPTLMSSMVGVDIRTGAHECFERIVIEFAGDGDMPGWSVEYVDDPVRLGESDEFVTIDGAATLQVVARSWMPDMAGNGYDGPTQVFPTDVSHILELRQTENSEGVTIWSIGLDAGYPFTVDVFTDPGRLVIDVYVD